MEKKRPVGVTVLGILGILFGISNLIVSILLFGSVPIYYWIFAVSWSLFIIGVPIGLLMLKEWARIIELLLIAFRWISYIINIVYFFLTKTPIPSTYKITRPSSIFWIVGGLIIIYYLTRPKVKEMFR